MRYRMITSPSNPHVKEAVAVKEKRSRYRHEGFLIEGPHLVQAALESGTLIKKVFLTEGFASKKEASDLLRLLARSGAELFQIADRVLSRLSDTEAPQGIIALASYRPFALDTLPPREVPFLIVVDAIQDPGNLGTIIRTADAAGADAVMMLPGTCDAFMPKVIRSTAGSIFNIPIVYSDPAVLIQWLREKAVAMFVTDIHASLSIYESDLSKPLALVFGNEARGAGEKMSGAADSLLRIPILGKAESLNVAASAAICIYEAVRQRLSARGNLATDEHR